MGQAPLDLPDPLQAKPLASAGAADDLLSQLAGAEIDRLLDQAEANEAAADNEEVPDREGEARLRDDGGEAEKPEPVPAVSLSEAPPQSPESARRETAVSSFVAEGDPALEAELDNLLANLNGEPVASKARAPATPAPEPKVQPPMPATRGNAAPGAEKDPLETGELDRVFNTMTAPAEPAQRIESPTTDELASPTDSIGLLNVLDSIVAKDAADAEEEAAAEAESDDTSDEEAPHARLPLLVRMMDWILSPLDWLPPAALDAMGKIGILTLINAAALLLYVLFFRRR